MDPPEWIASGFSKESRRRIHRVLTMLVRDGFRMSTNRAPHGSLRRCLIGYGNQEKDDEG